MKLELMGFVPEMNAVLAGIRLNRSYQHLLDRHQWSFLRKEAVINTVAPYKTGTATVIQGNATVTGIGTAWTAAMIGRFFQAGTEYSFFKISDMNAVLQTLTLESGYGGVSAANTNYSIFQHQYSKPADLKHIVDIRRRLSLSEKTQTWINGFDPDRESTGEPVYFANVDDVTLELYPTPDAVYSLRLLYIADVPDLALETDVPLMSEDLVITHALMSSYKQLASNPERGQHYLRLYQAAQADFKERWDAAYETDLYKLSLPTQVLQDGVDLPVSSDFWLAHDPFFAGR